MSLDLVYVVGGLVALFFGGEGLLRGAVSISRRFGLPELLIGLTVVGFGTSMPELLVSLQAALREQPEIALGNVVGSNIANILLIIGASALISPICGWDNSVRRDCIVMVLVSLALLALAWSGSLTRVNGIILLGLLACYLVYAFVDQRGSLNQDGAQKPDPVSLALVFLAAGFALLFVGAHYLIEGATGIAREFGVSEAVIGLTIVAVGTSLPELATSVMAALRGKSDIALGNVLGSNLFNILGILGVTATITPIAIAPNFLRFDVPVMVAVAIAFAAILFFGRSIGRMTAIAALVAYGAYTVSLFIS